MNFEWIAMEHYRLHLIEEWPDGAHKEASLAAIQSTLERLLSSHPHGMDLPLCHVCAGKPKGPSLVEFSKTFQMGQDENILAA